MALHSNYMIHACACSDTGRVRKGNEDSFCVLDLTKGTGIEHTGALSFTSGSRGCLFAVADGMGGAAAGELASRLCLEALCDEILSLLPAVRDMNPEVIEQIMIESVGAANRRVLEAGNSRPDYEGMGTTLTAAFEHRGSLVIGQIGDSRAYMIREDGIRQLTRDQSMVAQMVRDGELTQEVARHRPERNILLQALGVRETVELALKNVPVYPEDILLLCSDGLHTQISASEIYNIVVGSQRPRLACQELVDLANKRGGPDNITALLIQFVQAS
jgi:PPM family protein phosphatase